MYIIYKTSVNIKNITNNLCIFYLDHLVPKIAWPIRSMVLPAAIAAS